jgi:hypothetical protein
MLCQALVHFLDDMEFWKQFQRGAMLCLDHTEKCLATGNRTRGFSRLIQGQAAKLNALLDDLIRLEATGKNEECKNQALEWLADSKGVMVRERRVETSPEHEKSLTALFSDGNGETAPVDDQQTPEALLFENEKLKRKVKDLTQLLGEAEGRAASLHYRVVELSEINKRLEMRYTGASTQANGLKELVQNLTAELKKLKEGNRANSARPVS